MVATDDRPLQQAPYGLYGVGADVAFRHVFLVAVLDRLVLGVLIRDATASRPLVGMDGLGVARGVLSDATVQGFAVGSLTT